MAEKKKYLCGISGDLYAALEKWAADDLRSVKAQVEFLLTEAAKKSGRLSWLRIQSKIRIPHPITI